MSLTDFEAASLTSKSDVIITHASYLMMRRIGSFKIYLYRTTTFFIEVFYSPESKKVFLIKAFEDPTGLDPYTNDISISDIGSDSNYRF